MHVFLFAFCKKHRFKTGRLCLSYLENFTSFFTPNYSESYAINKDAQYLKEKKKRSQHLIVIQYNKCIIYILSNE